MRSSRRPPPRPSVRTYYYEYCEYYEYYEYYDGGRTCAAYKLTYDFTFLGTYKLTYGGTYKYR